MCQICLREGLDLQCMCQVRMFWIQFSWAKLQIVADAQLLVFSFKRDCSPVDSQDMSCHSH